VKIIEIIVDIDNIDCVDCAAIDNQTEGSKQMNAQQIEDMLNVGLLSLDEAERKIDWINMGSDTHTLEIRQQRNYKTGETVYIIVG